MKNSGSTVSQKAKDHVLNTIKMDMNPPLLVLHTKLGASVILGAALSLGICGQFGLGLTDFARSFSLYVHTNMDPVKCAILCGMMFSIFPVAILKVMTSTMQFRVIFSKKLLDVSLWILTVGVIMAQYGHHGKDATGLSTWLISAIVSFYIFAKIKDVSQAFVGQRLQSRA